MRKVSNFIFSLVIYSSLLIAQAMSSPKRILVTGANKGIGRAICEKLLVDFPDTHVLLGSRDGPRGVAAVSSILDSLGSEVSSRIEAITLDVCDASSVAAAVTTLKEKYGSDAPLYGLVNNAGVGFGYTLSTTLSTNYLGPKRVSEAFLELLQPVDGRIVNIASASGPLYIAVCRDKVQRQLFVGDSTTVEELDSYIKQVMETAASTGDSHSDTYGFSKACLNAYTKAFAKVHPGLLINSCTPGFIATDLTEGMGASNPPVKGTIAPLHCLFAPRDVIGSGRYYGSDAVRSPLDRYRGPGDPPFEP